MAITHGGYAALVLGLALVLTTASLAAQGAGGGLLAGPNTVTCKIQEQSIINECTATKKITLSCDPGAKGPGANQ